MTDTSLPADTDAADSPHYLRALTDMADRRTVVADAAIYTANGIKLVEKGARIDSRLYDRLVQHKLREPIDRHLSIENPVTAPALLAAGQALVEQHLLPGMLAEALGPLAGRLLAPLRSLSLPASIACKLTVMREQRPELFQHSLQMMIVAVFLGLRSELSERDCATLAAAALLHDLGVLHMDPAWNDPEHRVVGPQRKHLVAHPITAMLMIRDTQAYPRAAEVAVLEHHERMDGSGYPRGLAGADITPMGRILLLAEVVTAFFEKNTDMPAPQLSLVLRLNHRKFPAELVAHVLPLLQDEPGHDSSEALPAGEQVGAMASALVESFKLWDQAQASLPSDVRPNDAAGPVAFIDLRLRALQKALAEAGAHPDQQASLIEQLQGDVAGLAEVAFVIREALWQLENIVNGCQRRWPGVLERSAPPDRVVADWCDQVRALMPVVVAQA